MTVYCWDYDMQLTSQNGLWAMFRTAGMDFTNKKLKGYFKLKTGFQSLGILLL